MLVGGSQQCVGSYLEMLVEQYGTILYVVDIGAHLIHTVGGLDGHYIIHAWLAETAIGQVDGLVATVAQKDALGRHAFYLGDGLLELQLQGVGVAVIRRIVRVLVGIEKHPGLAASVLVTSAAVWCQAPDIGPCKFL